MDYWRFLTHPFPTRTERATTPPHILRTEPVALPRAKLPFGGFMLSIGNLYVSGPCACALWQNPGSNLAGQKSASFHGFDHARLSSPILTGPTPPPQERGRYCVTQHRISLTETFWDGYGERPAHVFWTGILIARIFGMVLPGVFSPTRPRKNACASGIHQSMRPRCSTPASPTFTAVFPAQKKCMLPKQSMRS